MNNRTYRYFDGKPLYPFGYGLSYSKFAYSNLKLSTAELIAGSSLEVDVDVKNTSPTEGDEVVELYLIPPSSGAPIRALRGFARIHCAAETQHVHFDSVRPRSKPGQRCGGPSVLQATTDQRGRRAAGNADPERMRG